MKCIYYTLLGYLRFLKFHNQYFHTTNININKNKNKLKITSIEYIFSFTDMEVDDVPHKPDVIPADNTESTTPQNELSSKDLPDVLMPTENDKQLSSEDDTNSAVFDVIADFHKSLDNKEELELSRLSDDIERCEGMFDDKDSAAVTPSVDPDKKLAEVNAAIIEDLCNLKALVSNTLSDVHAVKSGLIVNESSTEPIDDVDMSDADNDDSADPKNIKKSPINDDSAKESAEKRVDDNQTERKMEADPKSPRKDDYTKESSDKHVDDRTDDKCADKMNVDLANVIEAEAKVDENSTLLEQTKQKVDIETKNVEETQDKVDAASDTNSKNKSEANEVCETAEESTDKELENAKEVDNEADTTKGSAKDVDVADKPADEQMETELISTNNAAIDGESAKCSVENIDQHDKAVVDTDKTVVQQDNKTEDMEKTVAQQDNTIEDKADTVQEQDNVIAEKADAVHDQDNAVDEKAETVHDQNIAVEGKAETVQDKCIVEKNETVHDKDNADKEKDKSVNNDKKKVDSHSNAKEETIETDASNSGNATKIQPAVADCEQSADHDRIDIENNDLLEEMDDAPRSNEGADNSSEEADNVDEDDSSSRASSGEGELQSGDASNENSKDIYDENPKDLPSIENDSTTDDLNADDNAMEFVDAKESTSSSPKGEAAKSANNVGEPVEESSTMTTTSDADSAIEKEKVTGKHKADDDPAEEPPSKKKCENIATTANEVTIAGDIAENSLNITESVADDMDIEEIDPAINTAPHIPSDDISAESTTTVTDEVADKNKTETKTSKRCSSPISNDIVKKAKVCDEESLDTKIDEIPETKADIPEESPSETPTSKKPVKQLDLKPEPKPMKDRQMQLCHEFLNKFKKNIYEMTRDDLENFVLHKCAEVICFKSNAAELNKKLEQHEMALQTFRTRYNELAKQYRDLEMVHNRVVKDLEQKNATIVTPVKITRAVGLQVCLTRKEVVATPPPTPKAMTPSLPTTTAPQANPSLQQQQQQPQSTTPNLAPTKRGGRQIIQNKQSVIMARSPNVTVVGGAQQQLANQQIQSLQQKTAQQQQMLQAKMNSVGSGQQQQQQNRSIPTLTTVQVGLGFVIRKTY